MMKFFLSTIFLCFNFFAKSQSFGNDIELVKNKPLVQGRDIEYYKREGNNQKILQTHHHSVIAKFNPVSLALISSMYIYQNIISPQLSKTCAYQITCSNFSKQAIKKFGFTKGVFLSADRIMRCNRISLLDINPMSIDEHTGTIIDPLNNY